MCVWKAALDYHRSPKPPIRSVLEYSNFSDRLWLKV